jgi:hypothetical protein
MKAQVQYGRISSPNFTEESKNATEMFLKDETGSLRLKGSLSSLQNKNSKNNTLNRFALEIYAVFELTYHYFPRRSRKQSNIQSTHNQHKSVLHQLQPKRLLKLLSNMV